MKNSVVTITLNPAIDKTVVLNRLSLSGEFKISRVIYSAGGKGINVSNALRKLFFPSMTLGFLGGSAGKVVLETLKKDKVRNNFVWINEETRTNLTIVEKEGSRVTRLFEPSPRISCSNLLEIKKRIGACAKPESIVVFSGSIPQGCPENIYFSLIHSMRKRVRQVILDTSGTALIRGLAARPHLVKLNLEEAEYALGRKLSTFSKLKYALESLNKMGLDQVIISLGSRGAVARKGKVSFIVRPPRIKAVNYVGCGDALVAGFIIGQLKKFDFADTMRLAVAFGSANALGYCPSGFNVRDIEKINQKIILKTL